MAVKIFTNKPSIDEAEIKAVEEVLRSCRLTNPSLEGGEKVREFESLVTDVTGTKDAVAVSSGTTALQAALMALEIGPGDEVIVPSITFGATAATVLIQGAKPVFADITLDSFCIDPEDVKKKINSQTKAIVVVDLFGVPANYQALEQLAEENGLVLIEDCAQAIGATYHGRAAGSFGRMGCFSFYPGKIVTAGEGGMITTDDPELARALRAIRSGGMTAPYHYEYLGSNFRLTEIHAAIGVEQMKKLSGILAARRKNASFFNELLSKYEFLSLPSFGEEVQSNYYIYTVRLTEHQEKRDWIVEELQKKGIDGRAYYTKPVHKNPLYQERGYGDVDLPNTEEFARSTFSVPVHPLLTEEELQEVADALTDILGRLQDE